MAAMCALLPQPQRDNCRMRVPAARSWRRVPPHAAAIMSAGKCRAPACKPARKLQLHSAQVAKRTAEKRYPRLANKRCRSAKHGIALLCSNVPEQDCLLGKQNKNRREAEVASAPQSHGVVAAAGCQKRRRRVKHHRVNRAAVPLQSRHTSRR